MPTEKERTGLQKAVSLIDGLQAQLRGDAERNPGSVYAGLLRKANVPVEHLLQRKEKAGHSSLILVLNNPDEAALVSAYAAEVGVTKECMGQDFSFEIRRAHSGTNKDIEGLIKTGYTVVQVTDQGKPES